LILLCDFRTYLDGGTRFFQQHRHEKAAPSDANTLRQGILTKEG
jgi:hypothetical protein